MFEGIENSLIVGDCFGRFEVSISQYPCSFSNKYFLNLIVIFLYENTDHICYF